MHLLFKQVTRLFLFPAGDTLFTLLRKCKSLPYNASSVFTLLRLILKYLVCQQKNVF